MMDNKMNLFEAVQVSEYTSSDKRVKAIHRMVMEKSGRSKPKRRVGPKWILIAAVLSAGALAISAGYFTASDAFRGYLKELTPSGNHGELSSLSPVVDQTGMTFSLSNSVTENGVKVTPVAVAGDDMTFTVLFELENINGELLGLLQDDDTISSDLIMFRRSTLYSNFVNLDRYGSNAMETKLGGSKAMVLQRFDLYQPVPRGETVHLTLDNIWQRATLPAKETGLGMGELYRALTDFPTIDAAAFEPTNRIYTHVMGDDEHEVLGTDSDNPIPLSGGLDGYTLTNAAVWNNTLYLRGYSPPKNASKDNALMDLRGSVLVSDSQKISATSIHCGSKQKTGDVWCISFDGVNSLEDLKDFAWVVGFERVFHPLAEGTWEFDILVDYEIITREIIVNQPLQINGQSGVLSKVSISPYKLILEFVPYNIDSKNIEEIHEYNPDETLLLKLENGSFVPLEIWDKVDVYQDDNATKSSLDVINIFCHLPAVTNPDQVIEISYMDTVIDVG